MIELDVVYNPDIGQIAQKFGGFIEKGGIVFVALQDDIAVAADLKAAAKVVGNAADEKAWISAGAFKDPGQQRRGGGFAVGAGYHDRAPAADTKFPQRFRQGEIGNVSIQDLFDFRIAARYHVADHHPIRLRLQVHRIKTVKDRYALFGQKGAHGRIDAAV